MKFLLSTSLALILATTGCSAQDASAAPELRGLDEAVVKEILNSDVVAERFSGMSDEAAASMRQGIALNFPLCRSAYSAYETLVDTGVIQELAEIKLPDEPIQNVIQQYERDRSVFSQALQSGDSAILKDLLTNQSGCGEWIPVTPGDESGQTIGNAVRAQENI